jgi:hypothetical protein
MDQQETPDEDTRNRLFALEDSRLITTKQKYRSIPVFSLPLNPIAKLCETHSFTCFVTFQIRMMAFEPELLINHV